MKEKIKQSLAYFIYNGLLYCVAPFFLVKLYRKKQGTPPIGTRWFEYFGFQSKKHPLIINKKASIWFHTVSVGEARTAMPLIKKLHLMDVAVPILITTTTSTGAEQVIQFINSLDSLKRVAQHRYLPLDFPWAISRFLKQMTPLPKLLIILETELWPNLLIKVRQRAIPVTVVNARLSKRSADGYVKVRWLCDRFFPSINKLFVQFESDLVQFKRLGVSSTQLEVIGSLKFDIELQTQLKIAPQNFRRQLGVARTVLLIASTHKGEDELLLQTLKPLLIDYPSLLFVFVPRHPERFIEVAQLAKEEQYIVEKRSALGSEKTRLDPQINVLIGDSMGEMLLYIAASDIVIMGGSFIGNKVGGHNLLEVALLEKPSLIGASFYNFKEITQALVNAGHTVICNDQSELIMRLTQLLANKELTLAMGKAGFKVVQTNRGATEKIIYHLAPFLSSPLLKNTIDAKN